MSNPSPFFIPSDQRYRRRFAIAVPEFGVPYLAEAELVFDHPHNRHDHREIQILWCVEGAFSLQFDAETWNLPAGAGCAVLPGRMHRAAPGDPRRRAVILDLRLADDPDLPLTSFLHASRPAGVTRADPVAARAIVARLGVASRETGARRVAHILSALWDLLGELCTREPAPQSLAEASRDYRLCLADRFMEDRLSDPIGVDDIARSVGLSRSQLSRLFADELDTSPAARLRKLRVARADHLLQSSTLSIKEIARVCGFASQNHFSRVFLEETGARPSARRSPPATGQPPSSID